MDLAHTRTRPVHWVATATAMAAVIAGAGLLQPAPATGASAGASTGARGPAAGPAAPDPAAADYPLDCRGAQKLVAATAQGDLDGDGRPESVVAVHCQAGSGTPPHALYVLVQDPAPAARPRVVATLVSATERQTATDLAVRGRTVTATLHGYTSNTVPRCCPDRHRVASWRWTGEKFSQELTELAARSV
ncbi:hypothetical protein [Streptomyces bambusae]|uniref:Secreted protein n=1 Tax=Streptomyces bambusae TaxID=1550616 RepID=A0ABS6ZCY1_9ACTN|nr:hypothetical protein [Streptomyces bambusae]MBW5485591.1 hypothetical protein [Streptomyces bambusae]